MQQLKLALFSLFLLSLSILASDKPDSFDYLARIDPKQSSDQCLKEIYSSVAYNACMKHCGTLFPQDGRANAVVYTQYSICVRKCAPFSLWLNLCGTRNDVAKPKNQQKKD